MKQAILVAAYGTTDQENARVTIDPIFRRVQEAFSDYQVDLAYTSRKIVDKIRSRGGQVATELDCLESYVKEGYDSILVQPLFITLGQELSHLEERIRSFAQEHPHLQVEMGDPLLAHVEEAGGSLVKALSHHMAISLGDRSQRHGILWVAHGGQAQASLFYNQLANSLQAVSPVPIYIGTLAGPDNIRTAEGSYGLAEWVEDNWIDEVHIYPLFMTLGYHAKKDIVGSGPDSLASRLQDKNITVVPHYKGLGASKDIENIIVDKISKKLKIVLA